MRDIFSVISLAALVLWIVLFNWVSDHTWGYGRQTFFVLLAIVGLLLALWELVRRRGVARAAGGSPGGGANTLLIVALVFFAGRTALGVGNAFTEKPRSLVDVAANTFAASRAFTRGENPYASKAQLVHRVDGAPNVEGSGDSVTMFGVPYSYGYPYFPVMFLTYVPAFKMISGFDSIRAMNVVLLALNIVGVGVLVRRVAGPGWAPVFVALIAYLSIRVYAHEVIYFGIVDLLVSTYALYAFIAASFGRYLTAGILFGLAQGCKLLPGPLLVLPLFLMLFGKPGAWRLLVAYLGTSAAFILPFLLWNPAAFVSATILYYLTYHSVGDDTALWYFVSGAVKPVFIWVGLALAGAVIHLITRQRLGLVRDGILAAFVSYLVFIAFGKMTHLNYLWSIYPLGCVALALLATGPGVTPRRVSPESARG